MPDSRQTSPLVSRGPETAAVFQAGRHALALPVGLVDLVRVQLLDADVAAPGFDGAPGLDLQRDNSRRRDVRLPRIARLRLVARCPARAA